MLLFLLLILAIVLVCVGISSLGASKKKTRLEIEQLKNLRSQPKEVDQQSDSGVSAADREFEERWYALSRYDDDVRAAVEVVSPLGEAAVKELKRAFRVINDKDKIGDLAQRIVQGHEQGLLISDAGDNDSELIEADGDKITTEVNPETGKTQYVWNDRRYYSAEAAESARRQALEDRES